MKPTLVVETYDFDDRFAEVLNSYIDEEIILFMLKDKEFKAFALDESEKMKLDACPCVFYKVPPEVTFKVTINQPLKSTFPDLMEEVSKRIKDFIMGKEEEFPEVNILFLK